jgi:hypothetical protein
MYSELKDLEPLAEQVMEENSDDLQDCYGQPCRIKYLAKNSKKSQFLGKCCKASGHWRFLTDYDYVVIVWEPWWKSAELNQKKALLFHELKHIKLEEKENSEGDLEINWRLRKHDAEIFCSELERFGSWHTPLEDVVNICKEIS